MFLLVLLQAQIDGKVVHAKFTLPERKKVSSPPKAVATASRRDAPKTDGPGNDVEKDGPKRQRECKILLVNIYNDVTVNFCCLILLFYCYYFLSASPRRKPSPPRRRSPVARRGSPRRELDSPPRRRGDSPVRRRLNSPPYRRGDSPPPRRRPASPARGRSPSSPPRRYRSPPRLATAT